MTIPIRRARAAAQYAGAAAIVLLLWAPLARAEAQAPPAPDAKALSALARQIFGPLPKQADNPANPVTDEKVALGRLLYFDPRLSKSQEISCNSCHRLDRFGVDNEPTSPGHGGQRGERNSPTTLNAAIHFRQFWDGRAADVEEQAGGPMMNPVEMAMPGPAGVDQILRSIPGYRPLFEKAFPGEKEPVSFANATRAIAAFERRLLTPGKLDAFMGGDLKALSPAQQAGLDTFIKTGCITCHNGPGVGGAMFQKLGLVIPYDTPDPGRYKVTKQESDRHVFKVPGLRNVAETRPYFHDGSIRSLEQAVRLMAHHQLGKELDDATVASIVTFLGALTAAPDPALATPPVLPASGPDTPKPDKS